MIIPVISCRERFGRARVSGISSGRLDSLRLRSEQRFRWRFRRIEMRVYRFGYQLGPPVQDAEYQENDEHESGNPTSRMPTVAKDQSRVFVSRCAKNHCDRDDQRQVIEQVARRNF